MEKHPTPEDLAEQIESVAETVEACDDRMVGVMDSLMATAPRAESMRKFLGTYSADTELCQFLKKGETENSKLRTEIVAFRRLISQLGATISELKGNAGQAIAYISTSAKKDWHVSSMGGVVPSDFVGTV